MIHKLNRSKKNAGCKYDMKCKYVDTKKIRTNQENIYECLDFCNNFDHMWCFRRLCIDVCPLCDGEGNKVV